jgi:hypothetical protein
MDKKKQMIEEMARDFGNAIYRCNEHSTCCKACILGGVCVPYKYARGAYNAGYRKIPEGGVVLTKEEAEQVYGTVKNHGELLKDLQEAKSVFEKEMEEAQKEFVKHFEEHEKEVRKETAEKFAERLKELVADRNCNEDYEWGDVQVDGQIFIECVDEICKEISEGKV